MAFLHRRRRRGSLWLAKTYFVEGHCHHCSTNHSQSHFINSRSPPHNINFQLTSHTELYFVKKSFKKESSHLSFRKLSSIDSKPLGLLQNCVFARMIRIKVIKSNMVGHYSWILPKGFDFYIAGKKTPYEHTMSQYG